MTSNASVRIVMEAFAAQLAAEDVERIAFAHRLHKDVAGGMVACISLSEMMRHELGQSQPGNRMSAYHAEFDAALRQTLGVVRDLIEGLYPPVLKVFGFNAALQQLVRFLSEAFAGSIMVQMNGEEPDLELERRLNLFRIVENLLQGCIKNADTSWLEISCQTGVDQFEISIDHDGGPAAWSTGTFLTQMPRIEARCGLIQAQFEISASGPGARTRGIVRVPLRPANLTGTAQKLD
jgi:signal transduction histidine kinase